jgi:large subunit ribosomal protein L25
VVRCADVSGEIIVVDYKIEAQPRTVVGKKVGALRRAGIVPVTVYGPKTEAFSLQVPYRPLEIALSKAGGTNLISLETEEGTTVVLVRTVQRDVITRKILHVDFFAVDMKAKIRADVPLRYIGESPMVTARQGVMITGPTSLHVELLPSALVDHIEVDVTVLLDFSDAILVRDLKVSDDLVILNDPEELLARITQTGAARSEEEEELEEGGSVEPEVIGRGKDDEEEDED